LGTALSGWIRSTGHACFLGLFASLALASCSNPSSWMKDMWSNFEQRQSPVAVSLSSVATPAFSPTAGSYSADQNVTISCATPGASIHYTIDGSAPTSSSTTYSGAILVAGDGQSLTIKALASKPGMDDASATATFVINYSQVSTPQFSPPAGAYSSDQNVVLSCPTAGAAIYYTTGSSLAATPDPTAASTPYSAPIAVTGDGTSLAIKVIAVKAGLSDASASATYSISYMQVATPQFSPVGGTYSSDQNIALSCATAGAALYYTTGSSLAATPDPTAASSLYSAPIAVTGDGTSLAIKVIAMMAGMRDASASASYSINYPAQSAPTIGKYSGIYNSAISVSLSALAGSTIYYTLDGSAPTTASSVYAGPIAIAGTVLQTDQGLHLLKAYAHKSQWKDSPIASATFIVDPWMKGFVGVGADSTSNGIPAASVALNSPGGVCLNAAGDLYIADTGNDVVRVVSHSSGLTYFVAGSPGAPGNTGDGGLATAARLDHPSGVAVNAAGEVFISDTYNGVIRKIDTGGIISTVASGLNTATALAIDAAGNLYICETSGNRVWKLSPTLIMSLVAGTGSSPALTTDSAGDGGPATAAQLRSPKGIAVDPSGFPIWIADSNDNRIRRVDSDGSIRTIAGSGQTSADPRIAASLGDGGLASAAGCTLNEPWGLALDPWGNLYIADLWDHRVRKISPDGTISTAAGNGDNGVFLDGPLSDGNAWLSSIISVATDSSGRLYLIDASKVRRIPFPNP